MGKLYKLSEAAKIFGVTTHTLREWDKRGLLKTVRTLGEHRRIQESEINRICSEKGIERE